MKRLHPQKPIDPKLRPVLLLLSTSFAITWVVMMEKFAPRLLAFAPDPGEMCAKDDGGTLNDPLVFVWSSGLVCRGWPYLHKGAPGDLFALLKTNSCDPENYTVERCFIATLSVPVGRRMGEGSAGSVGWEPLGWSKVKCFVNAFQTSILPTKNC